MAYIKTNWEDFPSENTPITSANLQNIEDGIEALDTGKVNKTDKATGAEVVTGTDDAKYITAKALKDTPTNLGAWTSYTPLTANLTVGSGTLNAAYCRIGKTIHFYINFTLAADSSIGTGPYFSLPVTAKSANVFSSVLLSDANIGLYIGTLEPTRSNVIPRAIGAAGNYTNLVGITSTVPFTWTTTDYIKISGTYEAD